MDHSRSRTIDEHSPSNSSEWFCPHYGRDTCLIHFKCCREDDWYPCHKCHNEAVAKRDEECAREQEKSKPLPDHPETDNIPEDTVNRTEADEDGTEISGETQDLQERALTFGETEEASSIEPVNEITGTEESEENNENVIEAKCTGKADSQQTESLTPNLERTETAHPTATALDADGLKCTDVGCGSTQTTFSKNCDSCKKPFADYFCSKCKLLIESRVDPYHCDDCKTCRANEKDHFHCKTCNICMALTLKDDHKCFPDRGHDLCPICLEEVFSGAIIFPCFHMAHKDCAISLVVSGGVLCPMCRKPIYQDKQDDKEVINAPTQSPHPWPFSTLYSRFFGRTVVTPPPASVDNERHEDNRGYFERIMRCFGRLPRSWSENSSDYTSNNAPQEYSVDV